MPEYLTIKELINEKLNPRNESSWKVPPYQRAFEWDFMRVTNLVDSLLQGFDIGTIIVAQRTGQYHELSVDEQLRILVGDANSKHTEIIDGQQRCVSILAAFCGKGLPDPDTGRRRFLWINLALSREDTMLFRPFDSKKWQKYFLEWIDKDDANPNLENDVLSVQKFEIEKMRQMGFINLRGVPQEGWVPVSNLFEWVSNSSNGVPPNLTGINIYNDIQNAFNEDLMNNSKVFVHALPETQIPQKNQEQEGRDAHYFIRINVGGMQLDGAEIFFSGLKTLWPQAEKALKPILYTSDNRQTIFDRGGAITLVARCAAMSLVPKPFDPVQLKLEHLQHRANGNNFPVINKIKELTQGENTAFIQAVRQTDNFLKEIFGYVAWCLPSYVIFPVVAWSFQYLKTGANPNELWENVNEENIKQFVFWAWAIRNEAQRKRTFKGKTFDACWKAGEAKNPFPGWNNSGGGRSDFWKACFEKQTQELIAINNEKDTNEIRNLTVKNKLLFLGIFQGAKSFQLRNEENLPQGGGWGRYDLDHILAQQWINEQIRYKPWTGNQKQRIRNCASQLGNFSLINLRANRMFQANPPSQKFTTDGNSYRNPNFVGFTMGDNFLTEDEIKDFLRLEPYFREINYDTVINLYEKSVTARTMKIFADVKTRFPAPPTAQNA